MRNAFAQELTALAAHDPKLVLLSGDIGNRLFDPFKAACPGRFFNCGVAEANMASMAAGLAMCGLRPITYTIAPFNTTRCLEQIRDDICYHNVPVLIVGTGAGLSYASLGCTHHSCEDICLLKALPNMTVLCPADAMELRSLLRLAVKHPGPIYLRIGKTGEPVIYAEPPSLQIGQAHKVRSGQDLCILSTGNMLATALATAELLKQENLSAEVISFHTVKPLDQETLKDLSTRFTNWISLEEHSLIGGLGSSLAEWLIDHYLDAVSLLRFGTPDLFPHPIGSQAYLRARYLLEPEHIYQKIITEFYHENVSSHSCCTPASCHR